MNFSSIIFIYYFLPLVIALYYLLKSRSLRNGLLLFASLFFYAWGEGYFLLILLGSIGFNHLIAKKISYAAGANTLVGIAKLHWLIIGVIANLALLITLKYSGLLSELLSPVGMPHINVHLPLGISFFTFQAMSMIIDVYRGAKPSKSIMQTGLYISMFPQLVAGPIVRFNEIREQIEQRRESFDRFADGIKIFIIGLAQKVLIADILSVPADDAFGQTPSELGIATAWFGLLCFSLQIYYDFAGYSNMAIGLGRFFGFELPRNFAHPYSASSFRDFWRRWHMTLSRWFRDYLYIPLGGSKFGTLRTYRNLLIVFVLCGIWHGAAWTFALWGLWHGAFLILERIMPPLSILGILKKPLGTVYVCGFVSLGWVLFRANDLQHTLGYWRALFGMQTAPERTIITGPSTLEPMVVLVFIAGVFLAWEGWPKTWNVLTRRAKVHETIFTPVVLWSSITAVYLLCFVVMASNTHKPFLYFRF